MNIKVVVVGDLDTNCYIVEKDEECLIIDPGDDANKINKNVNKNVVGVLITHRHFDHIGALADICNYYNVNLYSYNNLKEGINKINDFEFNVVFNPGHTSDSVSFIFDNNMFSGDFVFKGTIGRCDIGGNIEDMKISITKLLEKNINYKIYPGHGDSTTLDDEREMLKFCSK